MQILKSDNQHRQSNDIFYDEYSWLSSPAKENKASIF